MQHAFCRHYVKNGLDKLKESMISAGYSPEYIKKKSKALLYSDNVQDYLRPYYKEAESKVLAMNDEGTTTFAYKVNKLKQVVDAYIDNPDKHSTERVSVAIKAIAELNKMQGDLAPTKNANINVNVNAKQLNEANELMAKLDDKYEKDY